MDSETLLATLDELTETLKHGQSVLLIGADWPSNLLGYQSRKELSASLAESYSVTGPLPEQILYLDKLTLRDHVVEHLRDWSAPITDQLEIFEWLAMLPINLYVTTAYHDGLYRALEKKRGFAPHLVVSSEDLGATDQVMLIHLYGTLYRESDTPILSQREFNELALAHRGLLELVREKLKNWPILCLGFDLHGDDFQRLQTWILDHRKPDDPKVYVISKLVTQPISTRRCGFDLIEAEDTELRSILRELVASFQTVPAPTGASEPRSVLSSTSCTLFEITIDEKTTGERYPVTVRPTEQVEAASGYFEYTGLGDRLHPLAQEIEADDPNSKGQDLFIEFGSGLFERLFRRDVATSFNRATGRAEMSGQYLRISLDVRPPKLAKLPWEYLCVRRGAAYDFLATSRATPLTRFDSHSPTRLESLIVENPLKLLLFTASPNNHPTLDTEKAKEIIRTTLTEAEVDIEQIHSLDHATPDAIRESLDRYRPHVVHAVCHAEFAEEAGPGKVVLERGDSRPCRINADEFARLFEGYGVKLLVLGACKGAQGSSSRPLMGVAQNVFRSVPAVVAMQHPIVDGIARAFSHKFYRSLAAGNPVDIAMSEARKRLYIVYSARRRCWGTPVLFLRSLNGQLFQPKPVAAQVPDIYPS